MVITSENYTEIKRVHEEDIVIFEIDDLTLEYRVRPRWLCCNNDRDETVILKLLLGKGLTPYSPRDFCTKAYGYEADFHEDSDVWPDCRPDDYSALLRVITAIYETLNPRHKARIELTDTPQISFLS